MRAGLRDALEVTCRVTPALVEWRTYSAIQGKLSNESLDRSAGAF